MLVAPSGRKQRENRGGAWEESGAFGAFDSCLNVPLPVSSRMITPYIYIYIYDSCIGAARPTRERERQTENQQIGGRAGRVPAGHERPLSPAERKTDTEIHTHGYEVCGIIEVASILCPQPLSHAAGARGIAETASSPASGRVCYPEKCCFELNHETTASQLAGLASLSGSRFFHSCRQHQARVFNQRMANCVVS